MNIKNQMEALMSSELKEIEAGACSQGTCVCENGGAGETVVVIRDKTDNTSNPGYRWT